MHIYELFFHLTPQVSQYSTVQLKYGSHVVPPRFHYAHDLLEWCRISETTGELAEPENPKKYLSGINVLDETQVITNICH